MRRTNSLLLEIVSKYSDNLHSYSVDDGRRETGSFGRVYGGLAQCLGTKDGFGRNYLALLVHDYFYLHLPDCVNSLCFVAILNRST